MEASAAPAPVAVPMAAGPPPVAMPYGVTSTAPAPTGLTWDLPPAAVAAPSTTAFPSSVAGPFPGTPPAFAEPVAVGVAGPFPDPPATTFGAPFPETSFFPEGSMNTVFQSPPAAPYYTAPAAPYTPAPYTPTPAVYEPFPSPTPAFPSSVEVGVVGPFPGTPPPAFSGNVGAVGAVGGVAVQGGGAPNGWLGTYPDIQTFSQTAWPQDPAIRYSGSNSAFGAYGGATLGGFGGLGGDLTSLFSGGAGMGGMLGMGSPSAVSVSGPYVGGVASSSSSLTDYSSLFAQFGYEDMFYGTPYGTPTAPLYAATYTAGMGMREGDAHAHHHGSFVRGHSR
jgi:hypothetical protein